MAVPEKRVHQDYFKSSYVSSVELSMGRYKKYFPF